MNEDPRVAAANGKATRATVPRSAYASWERVGDRVDPLAILAQQATTTHPDLVPIRHGRMLRSPLHFFRGATAIMAADLAETPVTGIHAQPLAAAVRAGDVAADTER